VVIEARLTLSRMSVSQVPAARRCLSLNPDRRRRGKSGGVSGVVFRSSSAHLPRNASRPLFSAVIPRLFAPAEFRSQALANGVESRKLPMKCGVFATSWQGGFPPENPQVAGSIPALST
jgi:hypothetical protein